MSPRKKQNKDTPGPLPKLTLFMPGTYSLLEVPPLAEESNDQTSRERFDINHVAATGTIGSVWGRNGDVFARLAVSNREQEFETDPRHSTHVTLRIDKGMIRDKAVSLRQGDQVWIDGYLVHKEYHETLRNFLEEAQAHTFLDHVDPSDLDAWRRLTLRRRNGLVNVLYLSIHPKDGSPVQVFGRPHENLPLGMNLALLEGIVARVWEYRHEGGTDLFTRLAVYDEDTPVDLRSLGNFGRVRRFAHYATVRFPNGAVPGMGTVRLHEKMRVRVTGQLRDQAQTVTLRDELLKTGSPNVAAMMQRVTDPSQLSGIQCQQESLHVLANALVIYSSPAKN